MAINIAHQLYYANVMDPILKDSNLIGDLKQQGYGCGL